MARRLAGEISRILIREVDDPLIRLVTITDIELTPDLKHARVFFSVVGRDAPEPAEALRGLRRASRFIRRCLAEQAELRFTPTLEFRYDPTAERAQRVETILHQIAEERESHSDQEAAPAGATDHESADHEDGIPDDPRDR
jgi:ribosome-binding factor A